MMPLQFVRFEQTHIPAVEAFNRRMIDGHADCDFLLPITPETRSAASDGPIRWTRYVVLDGDEVRGGVLGMDQSGWVNGHSVRALNFQSPLSEGIVNPRYSIVAMQMVKFMQKQSEAVFMVGMGSADRPLPKLLTALGWSVRPVPFLFRVHHAGNFLSELRLLRTSPMKRIAAQTARVTGLGAVGLAVMQRRSNPGAGTIRQVSAWGDWADDIWQRCRGNCSFAVQRDRQTLESLYPTSDLRTKIFFVERESKPVGWSVCFNAALENHRHFGSLRVGAILDCMAEPDSMALTATLVDREMASQDADLVVVNHSHAEWVRTFRSAGFLTGPSNYMLAISKRLTEMVRLGQRGEELMHVTRGDGDGRIHLA
jgi:hypothetical protein